MLRCLRPDKCVPAIANFVEANLGRRFVEPPTFDLHGAFQDSTCSMPLIFILSPGADPVKPLMRYAERQGMSGAFDYISLGQGQGPKAEKLIRTGKENGRWVLLMNCHLYVSWMSVLEKEVEDAAKPAEPEVTATPLRMFRCVPHLRDPRRSRSRFRSRPWSSLLTAHLSPRGARAKRRWDPRSKCTTWCAASPATFRASPDAPSSSSAGQADQDEQDLRLLLPHWLAAV